MADDWLVQQRETSRAADERCSNIAEAWLAGRVIEPARSPSEEQLRGLQLQIEALKERGLRGENVGERLLQLRRSHYEKTGASGG